MQYGGSDAHSLFFQRQKGDQTGVSKLADQGKVGERSEGQPGASTTCPYGALGQHWLPVHAFSAWQGA
jgi:hypothetical protein